MSARSCATCMWWTRKGPRLANASRDPSAAPSTGTCQVHAPIVVPEATAFPVSLFPVTHESRFCGDWKEIGSDGGDDGGERVVQFKPNHRRAA